MSATIPSIPLDPVALQVLRPLNPMAGGEFHNPVSFTPVFEPPQVVSGTVRDAILAANQAVRATESGRDAFGLLQAGEGAFALLKLSSGNALSNEPVVFDGFTSADPIGGPVTDRFERLPGGESLTAIVGADSFVAWTDGHEGKPTSLKALDASAV